MPDPHRTVHGTVHGTVHAEVQRLKSELLHLQDLFDTLRMNNKVLLHDLDSTRRERDGLISLVRSLYGDRVVFTRQGRPFVPGKGGMGDNLGQ